MPKVLIDAVNTIKQSIEKSPLERISPLDLASQTFVGRNRLYKAFKEIENKTIVRFQLEMRIKEASLLLEEGRLSIKQVALKCGYSEPTNFTSDFKKVFNMTPTEWFEQHNRISIPTQQSVTNTSEKFIRNGANFIIEWM